MNPRDTQQTAKSSQAGVSLIELMISMMVLGTVLVVLGQGLTYGIKMNSESKTRVSSLNMCKRITENLKSQIAYRQSDFDGTPNSDTTYLVDNDGNTVTGSTAAFRVHVTISNWQDSGGNSLTQTTGGVTSVLVKCLEVGVVDLQNLVATTSNSNTTAIAKPGREIKLRVEIVRPAATA